MNNDIIKKLGPHFVAFFVLMAVSFGMFAPYVFQDKVLNQGDNVKARAMQAEIKKIREETGEAPLWTNSAFGGMPVYQIHLSTYGNYTKPVFYWFLLKQQIRDPHTSILLSMLFTYLLLIILKVDWRLAIAGGMAYGLMSYQIDLAEAGHSTKLIANAYVPALLGGALLAYRGRYWLGGGWFALALALQLYANHTQITYYTFLILGILGIVQIVRAAREGSWPNFAKATAILAFATLIGAASNTSKIWPTYEYAKETIRGKSELNANAAKGDGLDKDYAFGWSYGKLESLTLLVPSFSGGGASQHFRSTKTHDRLFDSQRAQFINAGYPADAATKTAEQSIASLFYWGDQAFVGAPIYFGAIVCFLFILGTFIVKGGTKWWLLAAGLFMLSIAWGKNFFLNHILFEYFPLFNKFRSVSMAMTLSQLCFVALGMLGLKEMMDREVASEAKKKALLYATAGVGGLCLLLVLGAGMFSFTGARDASFQPELVAMVVEDRMSMMRMDALRSLALILASAGLLWFYLQGKLKSTMAIIGIGVLILFDLWTVDKRQLYAEKFETQQEVQAAIEPLPADQQILQDTDPHYRVLDLARGNPLSSAIPSYFHKSMGGYHAAKLMRYQELFERYLGNPGQAMHLYGMLNAKYIIQGQGAAATVTRNPQALGNAWFVNSYEVVPDADAEMNALANLEPGKKALIQQGYEEPLEGFRIQPDSGATIRLTSYHPDKMIYEYSASSPQLALFSEIYYPPSKGWKLYLDGEPLEGLTKANYLLRAAKLPAGQNRTLEMVFEPRSYYLGENISRVASLLTLLLFVGGLGWYFRDNGLPALATADEAAAPVAKVRMPLKKTKARSAGRKTTAKKKK